MKDAGYSCTVHAHCSPDGRQRRVQGEGQPQSRLFILQLRKDRVVEYYRIYRYC